MQICLAAWLNVCLHEVAVCILPVTDCPEQGYVYRIFAPQFGEKIVQRVQQGSLTLGLSEPDLVSLLVATRNKEICLEAQTLKSENPEPQILHKKSLKCAELRSPKPQL